MQVLHMFCEDGNAVKHVVYDLCSLGSTSFGEKRIGHSSEVKCSPVTHVGVMVSAYSTHQKKCALCHTSLLFMY